MVDGEIVSPKAPLRPGGRQGGVGELDVLKSCFAGIGGEAHIAAFQAAVGFVDDLRPVHETMMAVWVTSNRSSIGFRRAGGNAYDLVKPVFGVGIIPLAEEPDTAAADVQGAPVSPWIGGDLALKSRPPVPPSKKLRSASRIKSFSRRCRR